MTTATGQPFSTTIQVVRNSICEWFGGPYDEATRSYRTPQVANLGVVRRSRPKTMDDADYYIGATSSGVLVGSQMFVHVGQGLETRVAIAGAFNGMTQLTSATTLHLFLRSNAEWAEDAVDGFYGLLEATKNRIRADRCMGTGGWENGGFEAGQSGIRWQLDPPETTAEMTQAYLTVNFDIVYYEQG